VLVLALRLGAGVVRAVLGARRVVVVARETPRRWSVVVARPLRARPLAERFALRAPPLLSV
jgi:hypothetical protein